MSRKTWLVPLVTVGVAVVSLSGHVAATEPTDMSVSPNHLRHELHDSWVIGEWCGGDCDEGDTCCGFIVVE